MPLLRGLFSEFERRIPRESGAEGRIDTVFVVKVYVDIRVDKESSTAKTDLPNL